ncbi:PAS domain S-box protein [Haloarcula nitratireducens]|uniref:histidine kinase n=1 Tax=Haloarcula nitratireducens TaxID=2487749 RepID=A0AAW4P8Z5_9EURY|nr:PAS domain S-box protein [Halomicroarcula nitratireducens]MBX0294531.1 PAS domain S-box protein [Halomicroarcula nitratireducens]
MDAQVTPEEVLDACSANDAPGEPMTADEIAAELERPRDAVAETLEALAARGDLEGKTVDDRVRVWWRPAELDSPPDRSSAQKPRDGAEADTPHTDFETLLGQLSMPFYTLDSGWRFTYLNEAASERLAAGEDVLGRRIWEACEWASDQRFRDELRAAMGTAEPTAFEFYHPEPVGAWRAIHLYPTATGLAVYVYDIETWKRRERELKQYEDIVEAMSDGVYVVDESGRFAMVNEAYAELTGYAESDLLGRPASALVDDETAARANELSRELTAETREAASLEAELRTATDERIVAEATFSIASAEDGSSRRIGVVRDVTERYERERRLEETVTRLESFASMLAHELRNPVTIGQIYSRQLPDDADTEAVEYVSDAFDRIEDMIDVMLALARGHEPVGECSPIPLAEVATAAWNDIETGDATLELVTDREIRADETYLRHLFGSLFQNSVEHGRSRDGETVTVTVGDLPTGFYVADDGDGIPSADLNVVFEPGYTTAAGRGGTGLGLAFVEELAEVYGWECRATDSESGGARFEFTAVD